MANSPTARCPHIAPFLSSNGISNLDIMFKAIFGTTESKARAPRCMVCHLHSNRVHACLECVFIGCWHEDHIQNHARTQHHFIALDLRRFHVFCFHCNDYIYDESVDAAISSHAKPRPLTQRQTESHNLIVADGSNNDALEAQRNVALWHYTLKRDRSGLRGLRGMLNLGNTCFMNVVLQSLVHNPMIRNFFLEDGHNRQQCSAHGDALCLACDMDLIFESAFHGETEPYAPHQFLCAMWSHASHLAGYEQQDAHEFLISLLDGLHLRCGGTSSSCQCVVHRTFGGLFRSVVTCLRCLSTYTAFDPLLEIAVDLTSMHASILEPQTLLDCLDGFTQPERLADKFLCHHCKSHQFSTKQLSIQTLPVVLTIHLKRFKHLGTSQAQSTKLANYISFPIDDLDLSRYVSSSSPNVKVRFGEYVYNLFAVVEHKGSTDTGHYIAYVRRHSQWFKCDDAKITRRTEREVLSSQAYMLFYIRGQS